VVRHRKVRMVEEIEELHAELQPRVFSERKMRILEYRKIGVVNGRPRESISPEVPELHGLTCRVGNRSYPDSGRESGGIQEPIRWTVCKRIGDQRRANHIALTHHAERESGSRALDDVQLPSANQGINSSAFVEIALPLAKWQIDDRAC